MRHQSGDGISPERGCASPLGRFLARPGHLSWRCARGCRDAHASDGAEVLVIRLAIVDDYEVVLAGVARMFAAYADRIAVVELDANQPVIAHVDITLYDTFAQ